MKPAPGEGRRSQLEPGVAALAFGMSPGEIGLVVPDNTTCKYGYYLVERRQ